LGLGDRDAALDWLAKTFEEKSPGLMHAGVDPFFDPIRSDPRFISLLTKMGLSLQTQSVAAVLKALTILAATPLR